MNIRHNNINGMAKSAISFTTRKIPKYLVRKTHLSGRLANRNKLKQISNEIIEFGQEIDVTISPPSYTDTYPENFKNLIGDWTLEQPFVAEVPNVTLVGRDAVAISSDGYYITENSLCSSKLLAGGLLSDFSKRLYFAPNQTKNMEIVVSLMGPRIGGYYHWIIDYLTKVYGVREYEQATGLSPKLLIPSNPPHWLRESLKIVGYWDQSIEWNGGKMHVDRLVVPTNPFGLERDPVTINHPSHMNWLRTHMSERMNIKELSENDKKYIYVSRKDATSRRVVNEAEVIQTLPDYFESYELSELTVREQIELFSKAEVVIGPHGAGLSNILWGNDITVIEFLRDCVDRKVPCYFRIANVLNHTYSCAVADCENDNMVVDTQNLSDQLDLVI